MDFTGERFMPSLAGDIRLEHFHRYHWCCSLASGKRVLDIASGEGYGSNLLAKVASKVIGVDISPEAVAHAKATYADTQHLSFIEGSAALIPLPDKSVDLVVSFETIEHHTQHEEMISEIRRVLTDDGLLVISSPNKKIYSDQAGGNHNHFHVKELYFSELDELLANHFASIRYLGQRATATSLLQPLNPTTAANFTEVYTETREGIGSRVPSEIEAMYFVAIATNGIQPYVPECTAFLSEIDNALQDRTLEVMKLGEEIRRMSDYIAEVHNVLESHKVELREAHAIIEEIRGVLEQRDAELQEIKSSRLWKIAQIFGQGKK